jgi:hypothetical protein
MIHKIFVSFRAVFGAMIVLLALAPGSILAQTCVSSEATGILAATVTLHGSDPTLASAVQSAAAVWSGWGFGRCLLPAF